MTGKARNDFGHDEPSYRGSDFVPLDAMEIDLEKYPQLRELTVKTTTQRAGDCVFIPHGYAHQVTKRANTTAAAFSLLWERTAVYDAASCAVAPTNRTFTSITG